MDNNKNLNRYWVRRN